MLLPIPGMIRRLVIPLFSLLLATSHCAWSQAPNELARTQIPSDEQPHDAMGLHKRALTYFNQNDLEHALRDIDAALQLNTYYTQAYYLRGQIFAKRQEAELAIRDFDKAIEQDRTFAAALHQRALVYLHNRDHGKALSDLDQALALDPKNALVLHDRAIANREAGNYDQAVEDYHEAMRLGFNATDPQPLADLLFFQGRFLQSAQTLQQVMRAKPNDRHAALWRYLALNKANDELSAARELAEQSARAATDKHWPSAVFAYYQGKIDEHSLYAAAETGAGTINIEQQCQANFYIAEAKLLKGAKDEAISRLQAARSHCASETAFFHGANAELKRFGQ